MLTRTRAAAALATSTLLLSTGSATAAQPAAGLVGERAKVKVTNLVIYSKPASGFIGNLSKASTFEVKRLSPSGRWAFGYSFKIKRTGWVKVSGLTA